jgi:hypothetical protein
VQTSGSTPKRGWTTGLAGGGHRAIERLHAPLTLQLALAVGHDDLQPGHARGQRLA